MTDTPEVWKPVVGHEGYEVSDLGRIAVIKNGERFIRKPNSGTHYLSISFKKRQEDRTQTSKNIHVVVAEAFIGPRPSGMVVRHIDGNRYNNAASNVCYGTPNENVYDAVNHKTYKGSKNGRSVFDERHVLLIRMLLDKGSGTSELARQLGVSIGTIHAIKTSRNWTT
jgi:hypothetical protein